MVRANYEKRNGEWKVVTVCARDEANESKLEHDPFNIVKRQFPHVKCIMPFPRVCAIITNCLSLMFPWHGQMGDITMHNQVGSLKKLNNLAS